MLWGICCNLEDAAECQVEWNIIRLLEVKTKLKPFSHMNSGQYLQNHVQTLPRVFFIYFFHASSTQQITCVRCQKYSLGRRQDIKQKVCCRNHSLGLCLSVLVTGYKHQFTHSQFSGQWATLFTHDLNWIFYRFCPRVRQGCLGQVICTLQLLGVVFR